MLPLKLTVNDGSQVSEARRRASNLAMKSGWRESGLGKVELVVTELARNLVKHSGSGGELIVWPEPDPKGLVVLALDRGRGIRNISQAISDGYSTAGSPGTGLGAVQRLSAQFDVHSIAGSGTAVMARLYESEDAPRELAGDMVASGLRLPIASESDCGDGIAWGTHGGRFLALVVDGLGHGTLASEAANAAVMVFRNSLHLPPERLLEAIHHAMRATRGGVAAVAELSADRKTVSYAGIGNISGLLHSPAGQRNMVSHNGTLGQDVRKFQAFSYPWTQASTLIMHSDGLNNRWNLDASPGLERKAPALIAGVLYRDFSRKRDDLAILVATTCRA